MRLCCNSHYIIYLKVGGFKLTRCSVTPSSVFLYVFSSFTVPSVRSLLKTPVEFSCKQRFCLCSTRRVNPRAPTNTSVLVKHSQTSKHPRFLTSSRLLSRHCQQKDLFSLLDFYNIRFSLRCHQNQTNKSTRNASVKSSLTLFTLFNK